MHDIQLIYIVQSAKNYAVTFEQEYSMWLLQVWLYDIVVPCICPGSSNTLASQLTAATPVSKNVSWQPDRLHLVTGRTKQTWGHGLGLIPFDN